MAKIVFYIIFVCALTNLNAEAADSPSDYSTDEATDYFIDDEHGKGFFLKWRAGDSGWYDSDGQLSSEGMYSLFGVIYALLLNQQIAGNNYIVIEDGRGVSDNPNYSFIKVETIPHYKIIIGIFNNNEHSSYQLTFYKTLDGIDVENQLIFEGTTDADTYAFFAYLLAQGKELF